MPVNIPALKELQEERMHFLSFTTGSETGICVNMYGNLKNSDPKHVPDAEDVSRHV